MADLKFGDRTYRKMGDTWMMQPATLMRGFIAVSEESTIAMLDEIVRLRVTGGALVDAVERQQWSTVDVAVAAWKEARRG